MGVTLVKLLRRPALHVWIRDQPDRDEDYAIDWTGRLELGETIAASTFELPKGDLVALSACNTLQLAIVRISGGTPGLAYELMNRVMTNAGREIEQAIRLRVKA